MAMAKRRDEPDEAIGPVVNGLEFPLPEPMLPEPVEEPLPQVQEEEDLDEPVVLLVGSGALTAQVAQLAQQCGFMVQAAVADDASAADITWTDIVHVVPDYLDLVSICGIDRDSFICVFVNSASVCEDILLQCLATDARYIGVEGSMEKRSEIFTALKKHGAPDAELAAVSCPMGLSIGAETDPQKAVAIVAELLGAWKGALKNLRPGLLGLHRYNYLYSSK